jgi:hypothetical protein
MVYQALRISTTLFTVKSDEDTVIHANELSRFGLWYYGVKPESRNTLSEAHRKDVLEALKCKWVASVVPNKSWLSMMPISSGVSNIYTILEPNIVTL